MSEPKFYRRKIRPPKADDFDDATIPVQLLSERNKRRIEMVNRESVARKIITLPGRTKLKIRVRLFFKRLWVKVRKQ